jgi:hypothetical protein
MALHVENMQMYPFGLRLVARLVPGEGYPFKLLPGIRWRRVPVQTITRYTLEKSTRSNYYQVYDPSKLLPVFGTVLGGYPI